MVLLVWVGQCVHPREPPFTLGALAAVIDLTLDKYGMTVGQ